MAQPDRVIRSRKTAVDGTLRPADVFVEGGRIQAIAPFGSAPAGIPLLDAGDDVVFPGLVDAHVHVNEPGRTEWEGFETATRAAAAGGVTMIVDMPLNSVPATTTPAGLAEKAAAARGKCRVDVGFWGGVVPGNAGHLEALHAAGVLGFKCFLTPSGVDEFRSVTESDLREAMPVLARLGSVLLAHAEWPAVVDAATRKVRANPGFNPRSHATWLESRPPESEDRAIDLLIRLCRETHCPVHVVHLVSRGALLALTAARQEGLPITVETCPHYLTFASEEVPDGATVYKCAPPIRDRENREALWAALGEGGIDFVATDHSPCPPAMKRQETGDFFAAWGGIASLQFLLPAVWTGAKSRGIPPERLAEWLCRRPAALAGLAGRKGTIAPGCDADLVVWNPEATFRVDPTAAFHRHPISPYAGRTLAGRVTHTILRGRTVYAPDAADGPFPGVASGSWMTRASS